MVHTKTLTALAVALTLAVSAPSAYALEPCNAVVVDTAGVLTDTRAVEDAAASLARQTGAEVRVRIAPDHAPHANLDKHIEDIAEYVCKAWTNPTGARRSNLLIFFVTMNGQVGLYYGDLWRQELDRQWPTILERKVKPLLRDGAFDRALISGMAETARVIEAATQPQAPVTVLERETVRVETREPTDLKPFATVLGFIAVLAFLFAVMRFGVFPAWRLYERNRGMREEARGVLAACYQEFEHLNGYTNRLVAILGEPGKPVQAPEYVNPERFADWQHTLTVLMQRASAANTAFLTLETGPLKEAGTYDEYQAVRDNLQRNLSDLKSVSEKLAQLETAIKEEAQAAATIGVTKAATQKVKEACGEAFATMGREGFKTDFLTEAVRNADDAFAEAARLHEVCSYQKASRSYKAAEAAYLKLIGDVTGLPGRRETQTEACQQLRKRRHELTELAKSARKVLADLEGRFAAVCFEPVRGNGTEAEKRLSAVPQMVKAIEGLIANQSWDQADAALVAANEKLDDADELLQAIVAEKERLETAATDAAEELAEALRSARVASDFLTEHPEYATKEGWQQLTEVGRICDTVKTELGLVRPDVLTAYREAARADDLADAVYSRAAGAHEQAERLKRRAERERREALAELQTVERYFRNHRSDLASATQGQLKPLDILAAKLRSANEAATVLELVRQLNAARDAAYRKAQADFREAEDAREKARRAEADRRRRRDDDDNSSSFGGTTSWGSSPSSSSGTGFGGGFGGGSSGFGSGSSGFGGGSSSW